MVIPKGVSKQIDSCSGLIAQQAQSGFYKVPPAHRGWVSAEDMMSEALLAAIETEPKFKADGGAKFSTYLYTGLQNHLSHVLAPLRREKRSGTLLEIDAPVGEDGDQEFQLPDTAQVSALRIEQAVNGFTELCGLLGPKALKTLLVQLLCGREVRHPGAMYTTRTSVVSEIRRVVRVYRVVSAADLELVVRNGEVRKKCLTQAAGLSTVISGEADSPVLECTECTGLSMLSAIKDGRFNVDTMTCSACYRKLQKSKKSCFGKSFSAKAVECSLHCPDRKECGAVVQIKGRNTMKKLKAVEEELDDFTELEDPEEADAAAGETEEEDATEESEEEEPVSTTKKSAKSKTTKKAAKPEKAAKTETKSTKKATTKTEKAEKTPKKAAKVEDDGKLPFRAGSTKRYCFEQATRPEGVAIKTLKKSLEAQDYNFKFMLSVLRGKAGFVKGKETHTWKYSEEDGVIKVYDMKRKKVPAAA